MKSVVTAKANRLAIYKRRPTRNQTRTQKSSGLAANGMGDIDGTYNWLVGILMCSLFSIHFFSINHFRSTIFAFNAKIENFTSDSQNQCSIAMYSISNYFLIAIGFVSKESLHKFSGHIIEEKWNCSQVAARCATIHVNRHNGIYLCFQ